MRSPGRAGQSRGLILGQVLVVSYCDREAGPAEAAAGERAESGRLGGRAPHTRAANPRC